MAFLDQSEMALLQHPQRQPIRVLDNAIVVIDGNAGKDRVARFFKTERVPKGVVF
jgi:hypothetical protein